MKLKIINNDAKLDFMKPDEVIPTYEDKAEYYDIKKLLMWEARFDEILSTLSGQDKQEGIRRLFELAEEGYPEARRLLSDMYIEGKDLPEDFSKALEWDYRAKYADRLLSQKL